MNKTLLGLAAVAVALPALPSSAMAQNYGGGYRDHGRYERSYDNRGYDRGYYNGPTWRGRDGRNYCRRSDGTTGLLLGGVAGALVGRSIDRYGDRTPGTLLGALGGALVGQAIDKDNGGRRCR
ncbi:glycine zipper 2TM domain-containing protein [Sphingomonas sp. KR3-1]|uniref:glycine zipper 2TM domain-containing protein n=1 Tax=Sphingomonas sp. KR3-1 TaxID=3156611 RepID=UPI0032B4F474